MARSLNAFGAGKLRGVDIAFNVCAGVAACLVVGIQRIFVQRNIHRDMDAFVCGNLYCRFSDLLEEEISVVSVDAAVCIKVGIFRVVDLFADAGHIVQQRLPVGARDLVVAVEIAVLHFFRR